MFKRQPPLRLTNDAYNRWLRAMRPPLEFFLARSELEQEQLATQGDEYVEDVVLAIGQAVANPGAADAHLRAHRGDVAGEIKLAQMMAQSVAQRLVGTKQAQDATPPPPSMAGFGKRQRETATIQGKNITADAELFGKTPSVKS